MGKVIFWLVVFFVVLLAMRLVNAANSRRRNGDARRKDAAPAGPMLRCVDCGVYLPSADATQSPRGPLCGDPQCVHRRSQPPR
jgi:hypothetical protein